MYGAKASGLALVCQLVRSSLSAEVYPTCSSGVYNPGGSTRSFAGEASEENEH